MFQPYWAIIRPYYKNRFIYSYKPVLVVRPDDGPVGLKYIALNVLLMVIIDVK